MFQMFILVNIQKIKINSEDDFPLEKSVTMLHEIILFKSALMKIIILLL